MSSKRVPARAPKSGEAAPLKRFRIEKLEERIAPKRGGKATHNCPLPSNW